MRYNHIFDGQFSLSSGAMFHLCISFAQLWNSFKYSKAVLMGISLVFSRLIMPCLLSLPIVEQSPNPLLSSFQRLSENVVSIRFVWQVFSQCFWQTLVQMSERIQSSEPVPFDCFGHYVSTDITKDYICLFCSHVRLLDYFDCEQLKFSVFIKRNCYHFKTFQFYLARSWFFEPQWKSSHFSYPVPSYWSRSLFQPIKVILIFADD